MNMPYQQKESTSFNDGCAVLLVNEEVGPNFIAPACTGYRFAKRAMDIGVSLAALTLLAPLMLAIWCYIRLYSSGPGIFRQTRIKKNRRRPQGEPIGATVTPSPGMEKGNGFPDRRKSDHCGEPFTFYKFATMYPDARQRFPDLYSYDYSQAEIASLHFKIKNDPRVPPWARWLRSSSLDELPNFYNVLKGDMSLIGPRPDIPEMTPYYTAEQRRIKLSVKPGVTGFAQIKGRGDLSFQETLAYDLEYVRQASFVLDVKILVSTFLKLFQGRDGGAF